MRDLHIVSFYKFVQLDNLKELKSKLLNYCKKSFMKGTIILAEEGINAFVSCDESMIESFTCFIKSFEEFFDVEFKIEKSSSEPFEKMKIKVKEEIVTFGQPVNLKERGEYLDPDGWDKLISKKDTILIDTRNYYEYAMGTFKGAINPYIQNFTELAAWLDENFTDDDKEKDIAMFCTGGIRCEKSTAYLKQKGFKNVYHLKEGIIKYIHQKRTEKNSLWEGECFVFDNRVIYS